MRLLFWPPKLRTFHPFHMELCEHPPSYPRVGPAFRTDTIQVAGEVIAAFLATVEGAPVSTLKPHHDYPGGGNYAKHPQKYPEIDMYGSDVLVRQNLISIIKPVNRKEARAVGLPLQFAVPRRENLRSLAPVHHNQDDEKQGRER